MAGDRLAVGTTGLLFAAFCVLANGLAWGVGDHGIVEVFLRPEALERDLLAGGAARHPSIVWPILRGLLALAEVNGGAGIGGLPAAALLAHALHVGCLIAMGVVLHLLVRALRPDAHCLAPVLAAAALAPAHTVLGGVPTLGSMLLPRDLALPLLVGAFAAASRRRHLLAGLLVGAALPVHAPSAVAAGIGLLVASWRGSAWASLIPWGRAGRAATDAERGAAGRTVVGALPGALVALLVGGAGALAALRPAGEDVRAIALGRLAHHLAPGAVGLADAGIVAVVVAILGVALAAAPSGPAAMVWRVGLGLVGWAVGGGLAAAMLSVPLLWNLEPLQSARLLAPLVAAAVAAAPGRTARIGALGLAVLAWATKLPADWRPGGERGDVALLAAWAREHSEPGALFVLPPDGFDGFRPLAHRPVAGLWKDGGEAQFDPAFARTWAARMEALCGCRPFAAPAPPETRRFGRSATLRTRVGAAYDASEPERLAAVARGVGADWLVLRAGPIPRRLEGRIAAARVGGLAIHRVEPAPVELPVPGGSTRAGTPRRPP